jgi:hypothetical protein
MKASIVINKELFDGVNDSPDLKTIAHELGHGAFTLEHPFVEFKGQIKEGHTCNLMDYSSCEPVLNKYQWSLIQDPKSVWFTSMLSQEESEAKVDIIDYLRDIKNKFTFEDQYIVKSNIAIHGETTINNVKFKDIAIINSSSVDKNIVFKETINGKNDFYYEHFSVNKIQYNEAKKKNEYGIFYNNNLRIIVDIENKEDLNILLNFLYTVDYDALKQRKQEILNRLKKILKEANKQNLNKRIPGVKVRLKKILTIFGEFDVEGEGDIQTYGEIMISSFGGLGTKNKAKHVNKAVNLDGLTSIGKAPYGGRPSFIDVFKNLMGICEAWDQIIKDNNKEKVKEQNRLLSELEKISQGLNKKKESENKLPLKHKKTNKDVEFVQNGNSIVDEVKLMKEENFSNLWKSNNFVKLKSNKSSDSTFITEVYYYKANPDTIDNKLLDTTLINITEQQEDNKSFLIHKKK